MEWSPAVVVELAFPPCPCVRTKETVEVGCWAFRDCEAVSVVGGLCEPASPHSFVLFIYFIFVEKKREGK